MPAMTTITNCPNRVCCAMRVLHTLDQDVGSAGAKVVLLLAWFRRFCLTVLNPDFDFECVHVACRYGHNKRVKA